MNEKKETIFIKNLPTEERPRERMAHYGAGALSNAELLAIIIGTGNKTESVVSLSQRVLIEGNFNQEKVAEEQLNFLYDITIEELSQINGIGVAKSCSILAAVELGKRVVAANKKTSTFIRSPKDAADYMMDRLRFEKKEQVHIILLNSKAGIIDDIKVSVGGLNTSILHPREVFSIAVKKSAASLVLIHNHPSGDPSPSQEDISITKKIQDAGKIMGIELIDHIIIGDNKFVSLKERGII